jgi:Family of unknown function (DUF6496)
MPEKETLKRARRDKREGKAPSTQAGEFIREEIHHIREGKHGARSTKQAIAIGLSKARRAGVKLAPPPKGQASERTRESARRDLRAAKAGGRRKKSAKRSRATRRAWKREPRRAASHRALSKQAGGRKAPASAQSSLSLTTGAGVHGARGRIGRRRAAVVRFSAAYDVAGRK